MRAMHPHRLLATASAVLLLLSASCQTTLDEPGQIVEASIARHGGNLFEDSRIRFTFRGADFDVLLDGGLFRYERSYRDGEGREILEGMDNDGVWMVVDGRRQPLDAPERSRIEEVLNSTVYFGLLPHRLRDPAVRLRRLEDDEVMEEPYYRIEVTFTAEGGGDDWEDRFVHWIHRDELTLDYFAYRYYRSGGGTRFRRAVNRREIGGLLVQDQENYGAPSPIDDIAEYSRLYEEGVLELISMVELEHVRVDRVGEASTR